MRCSVLRPVTSLHAQTPVLNHARRPKSHTFRQFALAAVFVTLVRWTCTSSAVSFAWVNDARAKPTSVPLLSSYPAKESTGDRSSGIPRNDRLIQQRHHKPATLRAAAADVAEISAVDRSGLVLLWGALGVAAYLSYGVAKVIPIVLSGLACIETPLQWAFLAGTMLFFAYYEGYKGFQKSFAPRVVSRAWVVSQRVRSEVLETELLRRYGIAYLLTSILFSVSSFPTCFYLVRKGVDMVSLFARLGLESSPALVNVSFAALTYACWKAASPLVFALTEATTPLLARLMGVPEAKVETATRMPLLHKIFAPFFSMGYFHGARKRVISSWVLTAVLFLVVVGVKRLANPYRAILDAGVSVGLSWGVVSILLNLARSLQAGGPPSIDPDLPADTMYTAML